MLKIFEQAYFFIVFLFVKKQCYYSLLLDTEYISYDFNLLILYDDD